MDLASFENKRIKFGLWSLQSASPKNDLRIFKHHQAAFLLIRLFQLSCISNSSQPSHHIPSWLIFFKNLIDHLYF